MNFSKRGLFILMVAFVLAVFQISALAQTRIRFKHGASSATVSGTLAKNGSKCFVLGAEEGQWIEANLRSRNGKAQFPLYFGAGPYKGGTNYSTTTTDGDNEICIENGANTTTFSLTVSIR